MPSLPTKNSAPECVLDAYRRYLPPSYRYSFELYIPNSFTTLFITYLKFLIRCAIYILLILSTNFIFKYIENNIGSKQEYRGDGFTFLHDLYWFILLSLYCFCFTFICYRQIPMRHIHVTHIVKSFTKHWTLSLYSTSLFVSMIAFTIHYSLQALEWNKHAISSNHSLDKILTHWNICCNVFVCDDWTLSRFVTYTVLPPFTLFFNCFLVHYWLFGFHTDGQYARYKAQQETSRSHQRISTRQQRKQRTIQRNAFNNSISKSALSRSSKREQKSKSKSNRIKADEKATDEKATDEKATDEYDDERYRITSIDIGNNIFGDDNKLMKSLPITASLSHNSMAPASNNLNNNNLNNNNLNNNNPYFSIDSLDDGQPANKSLTPVMGIPAKFGNTSSVISGVSANTTHSFKTLTSSRGSPLNSLLNRTFIAFRYPESKMLKWILLYCITFLTVNLIFNTLSNVQNKWYKQYYVRIFIFILVTTSSLKWVMKRIARMIDASRGLTPTASKSQSKINSRSTHDPLSSQFTEHLRGLNPLSITTFVSLELCTELYMDFVFFLAYRELMMYYIPKLDEFFKISIYFFIHEFWICSIRPSTTYYKISSLIQKSKVTQNIIRFLLCNTLRDGKYHNYDDERSDVGGSHSYNHNEPRRDSEYRTVDPNYLKKRLLFFNWRDDCTLLQWQIRCSIDITLRILSGVICCVVIITEVFVLGPGHFNLDRVQWIKGMQYIALSGGIQLFYFAIVYIWNFQVQHFPLLEPWCSLQIDNQATWNYVCVVSIVIAFWLPDL